MSKYTTELRYICESLAGELESKGYNSIEDIINKSHDKIFSFDYPIFDSEYKAGLEKKIIKRYYTREICAETYGRWKLFLESRMIEIMPYYNQLYESALIQYDIFEDVNYTRTGDRTGEETGENSGTGKIIHTGSDSNTTVQDFTGTDVTNAEGTSHSEYENTRNSTDAEVFEGNGSSSENSTNTKTGTYTDESTQWNKFSDTPQGSVQNIDNDTYLTNATKITEDREQSSNETTTNQTTNLSNNTHTIDKAGDSSENGVEDGTNTNDTTTNMVHKTTTNSIGNNTYTDDRTDSGEHSKNTLENYSELIKGKYPGKSYMNMIQEFRETFLNIDRMVIDELSDLFMMVY